MLSRFTKIVVPEMNLGQLNTILRAHYLIETMPVNKVQGKPFKVSEIIEKVQSVLHSEPAV